jgi:hypothetical protein
MRGEYGRVAYVTTDGGLVVAVAIAVGAQAAGVDETSTMHVAALMELAEYRTGNCDPRRRASLELGTLIARAKSQVQRSTHSWSVSAFVDASPATCPDRPEVYYVHVPWSRADRHMMPQPKQYAAE